MSTMNVLHGIPNRQAIQVDTANAMKIPDDYEAKPMEPVEVPENPDKFYLESISTTQKLNLNTPQMEYLGSDQEQGLEISNEEFNAFYSETSDEDLMNILSSVGSDKEADEKTVFLAKVSYQLRLAGDLGLNELDIADSMDSLLAEMAENNKNGVENTPENIKTTFEVDGFNLSYKELTEVKEKAAYIQDVNRGFGQDYMGIAGMGLLKADVSANREGFSDNQLSLLTNAVDNIADTRNRLFGSDYIEEVQNDEERAQNLESLKPYFADKGQGLACNQEMMDTIYNAFSNVKTDADLENAISIYKETMQPYMDAIKNLNVGTPQEGIASASVEKELNYQCDFFRKAWSGEYKPMVPIYGKSVDLPEPEPYTYIKGYEKVEKDTDTGNPLSKMLTPFLQSQDGEKLLNRLMSGLSSDKTTKSLHEVVRQKYQDSVEMGKIADTPI